MREQMVFKRYELKYLITRKQQEDLKERMKPHMIPDEYGQSTICNIYFDTPTFLLVRSYGTASFDSQVFVELKKKYESVVYKRRMGLTNGQAMDWLCRGKRPGQLGQIGREIQYVLDFYEEVQPMMYLSYERE